jgi:CsoR family transcriptional regulator, copper-sensing transcriptional repressor
MPGGLVLDLHATDRIDGNRGFLIGDALRLAAAAGAGGRLRADMASVILSVVMTVMMTAGLMMAGPHALPVSVLRHPLGSASLEQYTLWGYMKPMRKEIKASCLKRLKRIEGQIRGLAGMVEDDRYCIDVVTQIAAAKAALRRVEEEILRDHVAHCVEHAIVSGDKADQRRKIAELMDVVCRADR